MESFRDYFKKAAIKAGSQNKLGIVLGTSGNNVSRIVMGMGFCEDEMIVKLAEYIEEDPARLLVLQNTERCTEKSRHYWQEVLKRYASVALILLCTLPYFMVISASKADAAIAPASDELSIIRRSFGTPLWRLLRRLLKGLPRFSDSHPAIIFS